MPVTGVIPQLRTTDLAASIRFYTEVLGCTLEFHYEDHYAGLRAGNSAFHLKQVCERDPSIDEVAEGGHFHLYFATPGLAAFAAMLKACGTTLEKDVHETAWGTREFVLLDDQGHTLYFGEPLQQP